MKKATKVFIELRKPYCSIEPTLVAVKNVGGGSPNNCANNALSITENGNDTVHSITGWLVHPYNPITKKTQIIQHWWNKVLDGEHFDTTPLEVENCEYIMDIDLLKFVIDNFDDIQSNVGTSIVLHDNGIIEGYESDPSVKFFGAKKVKLTSLSNKHIYGLK